MKFHFLLLSLVSLSWSLTAQDSEEHKNTEQEKVQVPELQTKVNLLERLEIDGHELTFKKVQSDGRCPKEVTCVWPGEARIVLEIDDGKDRVIYPTIVPALGGHQEILTTAEHKIYVINLEPYPKTPGEQLKAYQLVLKIQSRQAN